MTCVAVTGSSGYLGRGLVRLLDRRDEVERVVGLDITEPADREAKLHFVPHDVSGGGMDDIFVRERVERAAHLAFVVNPMRDAARMRRINLEGTRQFLRACDRARVKTILLASSGTAYGAHPDNPPWLREDAPLRANRGYQYAIEKQQIEQMLADYAREHPGVEAKIIRPCIIFGPNVSNFLSRLMHWNPVVLVRGLDPPLQFVHEQDATRAACELLFAGAPGPYNLAGNGVLTLSQQAARMGNRVLSAPYVAAWIGLWTMWRLGRRVEIPPGILPYLMYPWILDNSRLKRELGFRYQYNSEQAFFPLVEARQRRRADKKR